MKILWTFVAWQEYIDWQHSDPDVLAKINDLIEDIRRDNRLRARASLSVSQERTTGGSAAISALMSAQP